MLPTRLRLISLLHFLLIVSSSCCSGDLPSSGTPKLFLLSPAGNHFNGYSGAGRRSLLSHEDELETALVASLDGTIYLVESNSKKKLWSFTSGPSIYSSYHAPLGHDNDSENASRAGNSYFIDCGDDWNLYIHNKLGKVKLQTSIDEYLKITPHITEDRQVLLGYKETTVFLVDARTGRSISTYRLSNSPPSSRSNEENNTLNSTIRGERERSGSMNTTTEQLSLYITRTDYTLKYLDRDNTVLWNVTFADIGAAFLCEDIDNSPDGALSQMGDKLSSESGTRFNMPLPCQSKAVVYRFRSHNMLETFMANMLPETQHEDGTLKVSDSNHMLPGQLKVDQSSELYRKDKLFSEPAPDLLLPLPADDDNYLDSDRKSNTASVVSVPSLAGLLGFLGFHDVKVPHDYFLGFLSQESKALSLIPFISILVGFLSYLCAIVARKLVELTKQHSNNARIIQSKRKKIRKSGKNSGVAEQRDKKISADTEDKYAQIERGTLNFNLNQSTNGTTAGRTIGKLFVSNTEIAKGSNGTIILEGIYEGRPVAVKRLVKAYHDVAFKEIRNLIASDRHPNIVRWYGVECDCDFVYLALERCTCSLYDLIQMSMDSSGSMIYAGDQAMKAMAEYEVHLEPMKGILQDSKLWKPNGYPSPVLLRLMRDVVSGLVHLHELGIVHRDLKPQNVLIIKERSVCAKLSDMGISKSLSGNMSSLSHHGTGYGSSGWQAPEQLLHGRQTRAVDIFSLGCVLFFCITGGRHPFGHHLERDINIIKNKVDLFFVENIPEAVDLFSRLFDPNPILRPKALEVFHHPFFWDCEMRLSFLRDASDRVELEDRETNSSFLKALESVAPIALGGKWDEKMEPAFINNIGRYRRYKFDSVRDFLRVMRNKLNHYRELPLQIQEILGPVPEGFDSYFASRFPKLLIEVYKVMHKFCSEEESFQKYLKNNVV